MRANTFAKLAVGLTIGFFSATSMAAPTADLAVKSPSDMILDPEGYVQVADNGIINSYSGNGTIIDSAPLSPDQVSSMVKDFSSALDDKRAQLNDDFAGANGYAALKSRDTDVSVNEAHESKALLARQSMPLLCQGEYCHNNADCAEIGCPGDSCFHQERYFMKTCHDLAFSTCC